MNISEIDNLVSSLRILPGVGEKTAKRYAYNLIESDKQSILQLIENLKALNNLKKCKICNGYCHDQICFICADEKRDRKRLVVVERPQDILKIEEIMPNTYKYFALGGVIDPLNGINSQDIFLEKLKNHIVDNKIQDVTLILPVTNEGEITASYIKRSLQSFGVKFTKIAQGVPVGSNLEYLDEITLIKSIESAVEY